jgi:hypothetical protein
MAHFWMQWSYFLVVILVYSIGISLPIATDSPLLNSTEENRFLPRGWDEFCSLKKESDDKLKYYDCHIKKADSGKWDLIQLREHIKEKTVKYKFDIKCEHPANISVPWPLKAKNLKHLRITTCGLEHFLRKCTQTSFTSIVDELEYFHVVDSVLIINIKEALPIAMNISNLDKNCYCGHEETLRHYAFRNVTYALGKSLEDTDSTLLDIINKGSIMMPNFRLISHKCLYQSLEYVDESISNHTSKFHTELSTENSIFPSLKVLNLSDTGRRSFAEAHRKWFWYYPKLEVMDPSHNYITELEFDQEADVLEVPLLTVNITHNNILEFKAVRSDLLVIF